jgi:hypothetical protein
MTSADRVARDAGLRANLPRLWPVGKAGQRSSAGFASFGDSLRSSLPRQLLCIERLRHRDSVPRRYPGAQYPASAAVQQ